MKSSLFSIVVLALALCSIGLLSSLSEAQSYHRARLGTNNRRPTVYSNQNVPLYQPVARPTANRNLQPASMGPRSFRLSNSNNNLGATNGNRFYRTGSLANRYRSPSSRYSRTGPRLAPVSPVAANSTLSPATRTSATNATVENSPLAFNASSDSGRSMPMEPLNVTLSPDQTLRLTTATPNLGATTTVVNTTPVASSPDALSSSTQSAYPSATGSAESALTTLTPEMPSILSTTPVASAPDVLSSSGQDELSSSTSFALSSAEPTMTTLVPESVAANQPENLMSTNVL